MPLVSFTWNSFADARSCLKCKALAGYTWQFSDVIPSTLEHPQFGVVYDVVTDLSRAHGGARHNCRCWVTVEIDDSDVTQELAVLDSHTDSLSDTLLLCDSGLDQFIALLRSIA